MENIEERVDVEESSIDFQALWHSMLSRRTLYYKVLGIAFVIACVYAFSLPKNYTCKVMLAPELSAASNTRIPLSALSSNLMSYGVIHNSNEALYPMLYPDLMNSVDFKTSLFPVKVKRDKDTTEMTYYDYLLKEQKRPWWSSVIGKTIGSIASLFASDSIAKPSKGVNPFRLTKVQAAVASVINSRVVCDVDNKSMVISILVSDQDPVVCATIADSVKERLQRFITDYRTSKVRIDLEHNKKLFVEAKREYDRARQLYASFTDSNQDIILQSVRSKQIELENEMQLKFNAYNTIAAQLENAKMKVQEETPAFTTLQSATVPLAPSSPRKLRIVFVFLFMAFLGTTAWAFYKDGLLKSLLGLS
jgi:capsular polysaccharide biosynthesis protein